MAQGFSAEVQGVLDGTDPALKANGQVYNAPLRVFQATLDMADTKVKIANGDTNVLFKLQPGMKPIMGVLLASVTMGASATIAIGTAATAAKYRTAATFTTPNVPTPFMLSSAADDAPLEVEETVIMTIGAANLPSTGILQIFFLCAAR